MKGGSIASDAVEQLVASKAFENMNLQADGTFAGGCKRCSGFTKQHLSDYANTNSYNIRNHKNITGGTQTQLQPLGLDYSKISAVQTPVGADVPRNTSIQVLKTMASTNVSSSPVLDKTVAFGLNQSGPFNYSAAVAGGSAAAAKAKIMATKWNGIGNAETFFKKWNMHNNSNISKTGTVLKLTKERRTDMFCCITKYKDAFLMKRSRDNWVCQKTKLTAQEYKQLHMPPQQQKR
jgi:hypothetical protein